ncbi:MAG: trypsin-like peptidase domain-containing protein [Anaerolineae bacterium]|nr:trypsin-like peptidase domain-containing protein [Anaerolineae bacterium]
MTQPQWNPQPNEPSAKRNSKKTWITCGIIALVVVCVGSFLLFGGLGALVAIFGAEPEGLTIELSAPPTVKVGEDFVVEVHLGNTGNKTLKVTEIQLPQSLLEGAVFVKSQPASTGQMTYGSSTGFKFDLSLKPGAEQTVIFNFRAVSGEEYSGEVEAIVGTKRKSSNLRVVVTGQSATSQVQTNQTPASQPGKIPFESVVQIIAMVNLNGELQPGWTGSGSIISPDGLILTNAHVVLSDPYYEVMDLIVAITTSQDQPPVPMYSAEVLQADAALDLAVIRITGDAQGNPIDSSTLNLPTIPIGNSDTLQLGDPLVILGYPGIGGETITLTRGEVSGFTADRAFGNRGFIKTSATIAGGNSGGMATNINNELIGIPTQVGYGGEGEIVDCRALADTNGDGITDNRDSCIPTGGFINALRPIKLAMPLIEAARRGEVMIHQGAESQAQEAPSGTLITEENFSKDNGVWDTGGSGNGSVSFQDGELWFNVLSTNYYYWSGFNFNQDLSDTIFSVDARVQQATGVGDFGFLCRIQDSDNFYALEVSEDGYFSIWKLQNGETTYLHEWEYSNEIPIGQPMTIVAACVGNKLVLGVNDKILVEKTDNTFKSGLIGLLAGTFESPDIIVAFDNFRVYRP